MKAQTYIVPLQRIQGKHKRDRLVICTQINKGKTYPYGSKRQGYVDLDPVEAAEAHLESMGIAT